MLNFIKLNFHDTPAFGGPHFGRNRASDDVLGKNGLGNPFRQSETQTAAMGGFAPSSAVLGSAGLGSNDPLLQDIDHQSGAVREGRAPKFVCGPSFRSRTGSAGLDQLSETSLPSELMVRTLGRGTLTATATPMFLSAGSLHADANSQVSFGTGLFRVTPRRRAGTPKAHPVPARSGLYAIPISSDIVAT